MVNISTSNLIKDMLGNNQDSAQVSGIKQKIESGEMISDHFVNQLMQERLSRIDCKSMGFCLEGYPRSENQNKFMKSVLEIEPDIVFVLDCPDHIIQKRLNKYKYDPISGRMYSEFEIKAINQASLENRLLDLPNETTETIKTR